MSYCTQGGSPSGMRDDPGDCNDDAYADLQFAVSAAIKRAGHRQYQDPLRLKSVDVTVTPVDTSPECHRKSVLVSTLIEVQVDGDDLDVNVGDVGEELTKLFAKLK